MSKTCAGNDKTALISHSDPPVELDLQMIAVSDASQGNSCSKVSSSSTLTCSYVLLHDVHKICGGRSPGDSELKISVCQHLCNSITIKVGN